MNKTVEPTVKISKTSAKALRASAESPDALALRILDLLKDERKRKKLEPFVAKEKEVDGDMVKEFKATVRTPKDDSVRLKLVRTLKDDGKIPTQKLHIMFGEDNEIEYKGFVARTAYNIFTKDFSTTSNSRKVVHDVATIEKLKSLF